jgi:polysaccharide biosynthesis protein PslG
MSRARKYAGRRVRALSAAFAALAVCGALFVSAAQALPANFWGVVPQAYPTLEQMERLHRGGVQSVRIPIGWGSIQPQQGGPFEWSGIDPQVETAAKAGVDLLPFLSGAPTWAEPSAFVPGSGHSVAAPVHLPVTGIARAGWSAFLAAAVERYGPNGSFWAQHPAVPVRPIRNWQIWNEPNFKYFVRTPNPAEYGKLVSISSTALKAADPGAKVILAGMFARPLGARTPSGKHKSLNWYASDFLSQMYRLTPGIRNKFNGVALHPYTGTYKLLGPEIEEFRKVMAVNHDTAKGLWITELGWSSGPPRSDGSNSFAKGPAGQAEQLRKAFALLKAKQVPWHLQRLYWFSVDDQVGSCNFCDGSGLFGKGFKPKKSWFEYVKFAGGTP